MDLGTPSSSDAVWRETDSCRKRQKDGGSRFPGAKDLPTSPQRLFLKPNAKRESSAKNTHDLLMTALRFQGNPMHMG